MKCEFRWFRYSIWKRVDENISLSVYFISTEYSIVYVCMSVWKWSIVYVLSRYYFRLFFTLHSITMAYEPHISPPGYIHTHPPYKEYICMGIRWKILSSKWNHQENRFFAHSVCTTTHHVVPYQAYRLVFYCAVLQSWYFTQKAQTYL